MIEIFKTNVKDSIQAKMIADHLHKNFTAFEVNFDLEDCDRILRIKSAQNAIECEKIITILRIFGCSAELLPE